MLFMRFKQKTAVREIETRFEIITNKPNVLAC